MAVAPFHLIERAAQRLLADGNREAAGLLPEGVALGPVGPIPAAVPILQHGLSEAASAPTLDAAIMERAGMLVWNGKRERLGEEFRVAQGQVLQNLAAAKAAGAAHPNLIMLTSARPGEGKSFSAINLAGSIARYGNRQVLLVDVDPKLQSITAQLGLAQAPGLLDLAADPSRRIEDMIRRTSLPNLSVLPVGGEGTKRAELSASVPVLGVAEQLACGFPGSVILLDAPPCLLSSDPSTLAPIVGQTVMVVEAQRTQRGELEAALDLVAACATITLLLNKVQFSGSNTFGSYGTYGAYG